MELSLNKNWTVRQKGMKESYQTDVPAMVMDVLYKNGKVPDPYVGENEWIVYEELKNDFSFFNTFLLDEKMCNSDEVRLRCEGLDTIARIYINDTYLANTNDMHRTYCLDMIKTEEMFTTGMYGTD